MLTQNLSQPQVGSEVLVRSGDHQLLENLRGQTGETIQIDTITCDSNPAQEP